MLAKIIGIHDKFFNATQKEPILIVIFPRVNKVANIDSKVKENIESYISVCIARKP